MNDISNGRRPDRAAIRAHLRDGRPDWYKITNVGNRTADVYLYDEIGYFGTTAATFVNELKDLDVDTITLRINSPGGEVFDGIAIHNALMRHPATVNVVVDGIAASAASFIAMAGESVEMAFGSRMMIHDAQGLAIGPADTFREMADQLDTESDNIAAFYARRAGGTAADWRAKMKATTWYTADEAVAAGLADQVSGTDDDMSSSADEPRNSWDLSFLTGYVPAQGRPERVPAPSNRAPARESVREPVQLPDPVEPDPIESAFDENFLDGLTGVIRDHAVNMPAVVTEPSPPLPGAGELYDPDDFVVEPVDIINALHGAGWRGTTA